MTESDRLLEISRTLGRIEGSLSAMADAAKVQIADAAVLEARTTAVEARLVKLENTVDGTATAVAETKSALVAIKASTDQFAEIRKRAAWTMALAATLSGLFAWVGAERVQAILRFFQKG